MLNDEKKKQFKKFAKQKKKIKRMRVKFDWKQILKGMKL